MDPHEQRIVQFLSRPSAYPYLVQTIVRRETHVSHVFLAGPFAYKLKKPVTFPFLDASTLSLRKKFCSLELSLNRRLAPSVYLGMIPVVETADGLRLGGRGRAVEWLVKMRRLPEERMLDQLVAKRRVSRGDMQAIGDRLARFFKRAARSRAIDRYGEPGQVAELILGNLRECQPFVGRLLSEADRQCIESAYRQYLTLSEPVLVRRVAERRIIDGHGDLRCENICVTDPVTIFDCVEFQPAFRCGDMANDLSFLAMDLEFRGRRDLAEALVARYRAKIHDPTVDRVLPLYQCHRSLVRGKVRGLAWLQHPNTPEGRKIRRLSQRHFQLARRYAQRFGRPRLLVVGGLIGTGKSTLAKALAQAFGATWLRTDEIRLTEFAHRRVPPPSATGLPSPTPPLAGYPGSVAGGEFEKGLYAPRISALVYRRLIQRAAASLRQGGSVVCDGMFSTAAGRQALREVATRAGASFHFFECVVPRAVALRRVAARAAARNDLSEARPEHYDRLAAGFEPVHGWPANEWTRLSDNRPAAATYRAALRTLRRAWGGSGSI